MSNVEKCVQLLIENRDCQHCCEDHKSEDCNQKDSVCGGGKNDSGSTQSYRFQELFFAAAKVFNIQSVDSLIQRKKVFYCWLCKCE